MEGGRRSGWILGAGWADSELWFAAEVVEASCQTCFRALQVAGRFIIAGWAGFFVVG